MGRSCAGPSCGRDLACGRGVTFHADDQQDAPSPRLDGEIQATLSTVFREEAGKLVGALVRLLGNFEMA